MGSDTGAALPSLSLATSTSEMTKADDISAISRNRSASEPESWTVSIGERSKFVAMCAYLDEFNKTASNLHCQAETRRVRNGV
jgi:hypothetical protein